MRSVRILFLLFTVTLSSISFSQGVPEAQTINDEEKIFEKVEEEAAYPGGADGWRAFLQRNVNGSVATDNGAPIGRYTIVIQFVVDKEGKLSEFKALTKEGFGMEQEVIRILRASGLWTPAIQNGRPVRAFRKQPVTFHVDDESVDITTNTPYTLFTTVDNPLTVSVNKVKSEDLRLTISQGTITNKGDGQFSVKVTKPGRVTVRIYNKKDKEVGAASFEVREK